MNPEQNQNFYEATEKKKPNYALRRLIGAGALVAVAGSAAFGISKTVEAMSPPDLSGSIDITVQPGDTLYGIAENLDSSVDPRDIVHELKEDGVTPDSIQPGETISVPVSPEAEVKYEQDQAE